MVFFFYIVFSSEMQRFLRSIKKRAAVCAFSVISTENPRKPLRVFSFFFHQHPTGLLPLHLYFRRIARCAALTISSAVK